jgi:hypothetical protein
MPFFLKIVIIFSSLEFIARWIKYRKFPALPVLRKSGSAKRVNSQPSAQNSANRLKNRVLIALLSLGRKTTIPASCGDLTDTKILSASEPINIVQSIKDLPLKDFIYCSAENEYSRLGNAPVEVLESAWRRLLSEYYRVKGDGNATLYVEIVGEMESIKFRQVYIAFLSYNIRQLHTQSVAENLKELFPQFDFSKENYLQQLKLIENIEKRTKYRLAELTNQFDDLEKSKGNTDAVASKDQIYEGFMQILLDINQIEKTTYTEENISTYKYAILCKRRDAYIENLQKQNNKNNG